MDARTASTLVDTATSRVPASLGPRRTTTTHEFYRYPARFTPDFARAVIMAFTEPGQVVLDPFVGGGTTLVEARLAGRIGIGNDLNQLATFVAWVKSAVFSGATLDAVGRWADDVPHAINVQAGSVADDYWAERGYLRNVEGAELWRLRKFIALARAGARDLPSPTEQRFVRCALLRTAQWALDMRDFLPSITDFRDAFRSNLDGMADAAREYARQVRRMDRAVPTTHARRTAILTGPAQDLKKRLFDIVPPRLVLTSPPYPGVYVNYHRWKIHGRRETPLPYWIANQLDGHGLAYYTMGARAQPHLTSYFDDLVESFESIVSLCDRETIVVQVVGFSNPDHQLPRYLAAMRVAGLREVIFQRCATDDDGRLWRSVPGRRWWALQNAEATSREVVLFHRLRAERRPGGRSVYQ